MKTLILPFTVAATLGYLWGTASPVLAEDGCGCHDRSTLRYQEEMLEDERDQQIDALRDSIEQQEDQLRCWYKAEKAVLEAEYDRARRCLDGCARRQLARDHDEREDALRRHYYQQRAALRQSRKAAKSEIRDHYRQMERSLKYGVVPVHHTHPTTTITTPSPVLDPPAETIPVPPTLIDPKPVPTLAPKRPAEL